MVLQVPADRDRPARIDADHPGAVPSFLHQLERRLEVVQVLSHRPVPWAMVGPATEPE